MTSARRTGVLGGTFDPIHRGHLAVAAEARQTFALDEVLLVPLRNPPHRPAGPAASPFHRFAMAAVAALGAPYALRVSDVELIRPGTSYTADTLRALHGAGYAAHELFFLTGADAFAEIATWRDYPALLDLAHFVVCSRPGHPIASLPERLPDLTPRMAETRMAGATRILLLDSVTPDVSSTTVRARARAGLPIADLVPPEVESYIHRHGLYRAASAADARGRSAAGNLHE